MRLFILLAFLGFIATAPALAQAHGERTHNWLKVTWGDLAPGPEVELFLEYGRYSLPVVERMIGSGFVDLNGLEKAREVGYQTLGVRTSRVTLKDKAGFWMAPVTWSGRNKSEHPFDLRFTWKHCGVVKLHGEVDSRSIYQGPGKPPRQEVPVPSVSFIPDSGKRVSYSSTQVQYTGMPGKWLLPGAYTVVMRAEWLETFTTRVVVETDKVTQVPYHVARFEGGRTLRGGFIPAGRHHTKARQNPSDPSRLRSMRATRHGGPTMYQWSASG